MPQWFGTIYMLYGAFAKHGCAYPVGYKST